MNMGTSKAEKKQEGQGLVNKCWKFLQPLLEQLYGLGDRNVLELHQIQEGFRITALDQMGNTPPTPADRFFPAQIFFSP